MTYVARRGCRRRLRAGRSVPLGTPEFSNPYSHGPITNTSHSRAQSERTRIPVSCRSFHPIDEPSPAAAPGSARQTPRSGCASRRPALSGGHRFRSSRRLDCAFTLAFRGLTRAPLSRWYTHEHLVHMLSAALMGQLPARPTDSTLTHDYSSSALRLTYTTFTPSPQGTPEFTPSP